MLQKPSTACLKARFGLRNGLKDLNLNEEQIADLVRISVHPNLRNNPVYITDEMGFIRAEVVSYQDLYQCGTYNAAKEKGLVRIEGKDYVVQDGDSVHPNLRNNPVYITDEMLDEMYHYLASQD